MTTDTPVLPVTESALARAGMTPDPRLREIMTSLIGHLHAFVTEVKLTPDEWTAAISFLTRTGHACTDLRQEFILLSDTLGVSVLVDEMANPKPPPATPSSVLGPFYTHDAPEIAHGDTIARSGKGELTYVRGTVRDMQGKPIPGALVEAWETDGEGTYDTQYAVREAPDYRGYLHTGPDGRYAFYAVKPVSYSVPTDGPVGEMLRAAGRLSMRPAHLHLKVSAAGYEPLTTSAYTAGDPYIDADAVYGVKPELIRTYEPYKPEAHGALDPAPQWVLDFDIVLPAA
ncbi:MAG TPA: dioxygenase [Candidatus Sulfotelmatobacter sp.]|nr:dioxygenase [Candidatus Sulfotelmatobacter sp.]